MSLQLLLLLLATLHVGCDGVVGSGRVRDACGVCGGRNSSCQIISGIFTEPRLQPGYSLVVQIPAGACNIHIEELGATKNYLALRDIRSKFIINGDWNIDNSGTYPGAGATFTYRRQPSDASANQGDRITALGPIAEPVDIVILYQEVNRGIKYEYAIKNEDSLGSVLPRLPPGPGQGQLPSSLPNALLRPAGDQRSPDTPPAPRLPSAGVGAGFVSPLYQPLRPTSSDRAIQPNDGRSVPHRGGLGRKFPVGRAPQSVGIGRAAPQDRAAGSRAHGGRGAGSRQRGDSKTGRKSRGRGRHRRRRRHRFQWVSTGFSECSRSCGGGTQTQQVVCMRRKRKQLARDRRCDARRRPKATTRKCNTFSCPASWEPSPWTACSVSCGSGHQKRAFLCVRSGRPVDVSECPGRPTQPDTQPCRLRACPAPARWRIDEWSQCSVTCGWGTRSREVACVESDASRCVEADRPRTQAPCQQPACPAVTQDDRPGHGWMVTEWTQQCSAECGRGLQWRGVVCGRGTGRCDASLQPVDTRPCKTDRGCDGIWFTGPWSQCSHQCGPGTASRTVLCVSFSSGQYGVVSDRACSSRRPRAEQSCGDGDCPAAWFSTEWSPCSVSCGPGSQSRTVACVDSAGRRAAGCSAAEAPPERRACLLAECPKIGNSYHMRVEWAMSPEPEVRLLHG